MMVTKGLSFNQARLLKSVQRWLCACCLIACFAPVAHATVFRATLERAQWQLDPSPLHCKLWQHVPGYGDAVFMIKSGEDLRFELHSKKAVGWAGRADISVIAPDWKPGVRKRELVQVGSEMGVKPVSVDEDMASQLLAELAAGMFPAIRHTGWYNGHWVSVEVSSVNFDQAYQGYLDCVAAMIPVGFEDIKLSTFYYEFNKHKLSDEKKQRLDLVSRYANEDGSVRAVRINAFADAVGRRGHNWELSRLRGDNVMQYLLSQGVDESMIRFNFYGESNPVVPNSSRVNRAKNRIVTVTLLR